MRAPSEPDTGCPPTDFEELAKNLARMVEQGGKALAAYLKPREEGRVESDHAEFVDMVKTLGQVAEYWLADPARTFELQSTLGKGYLDLWAHAARRLAGETDQAGRGARPARQALRRSGMVVEPVLRFPQAGLSPDRRFADRLVKDAEGLDPLTRQKADFYVRQIVNAIAPSNFVLTNPELLRDTLPPRARISRAACTCWRRTSRPAAGSCASARPTPRSSRSAAISRPRPAR